MADLRLTIEDVIESLKREALDRVEGLQQCAARLEAELRTVASATGAAQVFDFKNADALHAFDVVLPYDTHPGQQIVLSLGGMGLGDSITRRPLEKGHYRAILQLTKIADEEPRR
jgi:hypothetical protein